MAAFTTRVATARIKAQTVVTLAPFNTNLTPHDHKSVVQLQTHVCLFHCFIRLFVNKTWWRASDRNKAALLIVSGRIDTNHIPDRISVVNLGAPYFEGLMRWNRIDGRWSPEVGKTPACTSEHVFTKHALRLLERLCLRRRGSTPELGLLHHLWHHLMRLICSLTPWTLPDY